MTNRDRERASQLRRLQVVREMLERLADEVKVLEIGVALQAVRYIEEVVRARF